MAQYTQSLQLIPSKRAEVFKVVLTLESGTRRIGKLDKSGLGTFTAKRKEQHLHRLTNSLGVNLELLQRHEFKWIVIDFCGQTLVTTRNFILYHGRVMTFGRGGYEPQCFLKLEHWGRDKAEAFEGTLVRQGDLFEEVAT